MIRVGINGFGRIGRLALRIASNNPNIQIVAINSRGNADSHAFLAKYDSTYGIWDQEIYAQDNELFVAGEKIAVFQCSEPSEIPWDQAQVDIVIEATGKLKNREECEKHLKPGVKKIIMASPGKGLDGTFVLGVNEETYDAKIHHIISNASCTTNCLAPLVKILDEAFGIEYGTMTTIHAFTNDQNTLDNSHKDKRRARTATASMIPTTTGAAKAVGEVLPHLKGKIDGMAVRVPTQTVSMVDFVAHVKKSTTKEEINALFEQKKNHIMDICPLPLVSIDYKGNSHSSIVDAELTQVIGGNLIKVMSWYDNEWGYTCRLVDLIEYIGKQ